MFACSRWRCIYRLDFVFGCCVSLYQCFRAASAAGAAFFLSSTFLPRAGMASRYLLWGRSMGAASALLYAARYPNSDLCGLILDSPFCSFRRLARDLVIEGQVGSGGKPDRSGPDSLFCDTVPPHSSACRCFAVPSEHSHMRGLGWPASLVGGAMIRPYKATVGCAHHHGTCTSKSAREPSAPSGALARSGQRPRLSRERGAENAPAQRQEEDPLRPQDRGAHRPREKHPVPLPLHRREEGHDGQAKPRRRPVGGRGRGEPVHHLQGDAQHGAARVSYLVEWTCGTRYEI